MELVCDLAIPHLSMHSKKMKSEHCRDVYNFNLIAMFMIIKLWNQSKCPSMEEGVKTMWFVYKQRNGIQPYKKRNPVIYEKTEEPRGNC